MHKFILKKNNFSTILLLFSIIILIEAYIIFEDKLPKIHFSHSAKLTTYADKIIKLCSTERFHPACYDREIPKLMKEISMEDAFEVTKIIQVKTQDYPFCHVLAHKLASLEVIKDPLKWKDVAARTPTNICSNGGIHGAFQERFRTENMTPQEIESIKPELSTICDKREGWDPTNLDRAGCYHALGHLNMYLTKGDINASLKLCDEISIKKGGENLSQSCYDGAFMQIFQPLEPEDFALIKGKEVKPDQLKDFCGKFDEKQKATCWAEGWPLFNNKVTTPNGLLSYCTDSLLKTESSKQRCFNGLFYMVVVNVKFDMNKFSDFCSELPESASGICFRSGASRLITTDYSYIPKAMDFCKSGRRQYDIDSCYSELLNYALYTFPAGSKESRTICNTLPTSWKNKCNA